MPDSSDAVAYIARPGQFPGPDSTVCDPAYWSARRFSPEVVEALDKAIDILKERSGAEGRTYRIFRRRCDLRPRCGTPH